MQKKTACGINKSRMSASKGESAVIRTVFLDLDNTLLDFDRSEATALGKTLRERGIHPSEEMLRRYHVINMACWKKLETGELTREQVMAVRFERLLAEYHAAGSGREVSERYEALLAKEHHLMPGARELLETLAPRYDLYAASNGSAAVQYQRLYDAGVTGYFRDIFISEEVGFDKPDPRFFQRCFDTIPGFSRERAILVGDSLTSDIRGGRAARIRTCWYAPGQMEREPQPRPDFIITELGQLPELLAGL